LLEELVLELESAGVGLVSCLYRLPVPGTLAMCWEAVAVNADFWSQVLQAKSLRRLDFALGAVMAMRREALQGVHGFEALVDFLADDFQLGHRMARAGYDVRLANVLVECRPDPMGWRAVWKHQLRWARTIRVCRPAAYFCSILSNPTLWPLVLVAVSSSPAAWVVAVVCWGVRLVGAMDLQRRLFQHWPPAHRFWVPWLKDLLQVAVWAEAFCGNTVEWRGGRLQFRSDGRLVKAAAPLQSP
jgi:ceramide glucosyltransferase